MPESTEIHGYCDDRFASVKQAFAKNFDEGLEVGASFAATIEGELVADIWAGYADAACTRPWESDTIVNVYSTTKVMTALCMLMLVDRGLLDIDAPVAHYWPEFAQAGKEKIPVRYLLTHQAGLAGIVEPTPSEALYDWDRIVKLLAAQKPLWEPGTDSGYHAVTFGYLLGEVLRRITGKTLGTFFREEVAEPLGADFHIGLDERHDSRVAELIPPESYASPVLNPDSELGKAMANGARSPKRTQDRAWRAAEIPASNGHGNARSVARVATALACGGELDGVRLLGMPTIEKSIEEQCYGKDLVLGQPIRWGLGWALKSEEAPIGPNPRTFYWGGWGGSAVIMDLDAKVGFAYVMNKMNSGALGDRRVVGPAMALFSGLQD
jgi:CubicO group peptidase (beta-lactamase class C family)